MAAPRTRSERIAIGFMVVWLVFWLAGILVVVWGLGATALGGNLEAALAMAIWLIAAGFGLFAGARRLRKLLLRETPPPRGIRNHQWKDDFGPPQA